MKKYFYLVLIAVSAIATSCKHHASDSASSIDLVKDSIYLYAQEDYLWYDALPSQSTFNPRSYTSTTDIAALQKEVDAISQFKINPATNLPYEYNTSYPGESKYSFIDEGQVATLLSGSSGDFGFFPVYATSATDLRIKYVQPNSPAAAAGMHRGDLITSITNVSSLDGTSSTNIAAINAALQASTIKMTLKRNSGATYSVSLAVTNYTTNPVMKDTVYTTSNNKKVGYMVFSTFTQLTNAQAQIDAAFTYFIGQNITDLVIDLRYNGGGAVETAEYLDNLIVPAAKSGTVMYTAYFNTKLQNNQYPLLNRIFPITAGDFSVANNTVKFSKQKTLAISRVMFIVTGNTASASELTINNLEPEMDVRLVGATTYGKPVAFFAITIGAYQLYIPEIENRNSLGQANFYTGMVPGSANFAGYATADDYLHDFGDPSEGMLAHCLSYINVGTYAISQPQVDAIGTANTISVAQQNKLNSGLDDHSLTKKGVMVYSKHKLVRRAH